MSSRPTNDLLDSDQPGGTPHGDLIKQNDEIESQLLDTLPEDKKRLLENMGPGDEFLEKMDNMLNDLETQSSNPMSLMDEPDLVIPAEATVSQFSEPSSSRNVIETSTIKLPEKQNTSVRPPPKTVVNLKSTVPEKIVTPPKLVSPPQASTGGTFFSHTERNQRVINSLKGVRAPPSLSASLRGPPPLPKSDSVSDTHLGKIDELLHTAIEDLKVEKELSQSLSLHLSQLTAIVKQLQEDVSELAGNFTKLNRRLDNPSSDPVRVASSIQDTSAEINLGHIHADSSRSKAVASVAARAKPSSSASVISSAAPAKVAMRFRIK